MAESARSLNMSANRRAQEKTVCGGGAVGRERVAG